MSYWIVACSSAEKPKESVFESLSEKLIKQNRLAESVHMFAVPDNLKFGSFDSLIKLVDDLGKFDGQVEAIVRRVERQAIDLDSSIELGVLLSHKPQQVSISEYIENFRWDDVKYPRARNLQDNIQMLLNAIAKIDEEVKNKSQQYTDVKQHAQLFVRKEQVSHLQRDLIDLFAPDLAKEGDFVYSEHLTTVLVVVPRGAENEFSESYQSFDEYVVPGSAQKVALDDKEGNSLWRVVMFKRAVESFRQNARQRRFTVRDFTYDQNKYSEMIQNRATSELDLKKQESILKKVCQCAFSDCMVAWVHLKAMRTFVEAVLRFGVPPKFGSFLVYSGPKYLSKQGKMKAEIGSVLISAGGFFGSGFSDPKANGASSDNAGSHHSGGVDEEGGEYYPYVLIPFAPTTSSRGA